MNQTTIFDAIKSNESKVSGMSQAAENKKSLLEFARKGLIEIARSRPDRCVTADDAQLYLVKNGISVRALGSAAGSLFKTKDWEFTGKLVKSVRVHAHSNLLRVWRLK